jgi:hypothetical protein
MNWFVCPGRGFMGFRRFVFDDFGAVSNPGYSTLHKHCAKEVYRKISIGR